MRLLILAMALAAAFGASPPADFWYAQYEAGGLAPSAAARALARTKSRGKNQ